jgi:uncharacterized protein YlxW (UPF0749 family)
MSAPGGPDRRGRERPRRFNPDLLTEMIRNPLDVGYAEAARRRAARGQDSPRRHAAGRAAFAGVMVVTGFLLTLAWHQTVAAAPESLRTRNNLVVDVKSRQAETDRLARQADDLRAQVNRARDAELAGAETEALRRLEAAAGVTRVRGGGVVVQLVDAPPVVDPVSGKQSDVNLGRVQDRDLQDVANELWRDGAEAIAINGERLTATSTIRTAGSTILVDFRPITSPYQVQAIGPGDLDRRFTSSPTGRKFRAIVEAYHMQVSVRRQDDLSLAAATDPQLHYAETIPSDTPAPSGSPAGAGGSKTPSPGGR